MYLSCTAFKILLVISHYSTRSNREQNLLPIVDVVPDVGCVVVDVDADVSRDVLIGSVVVVVSDDVTPGSMIHKSKNQRTKHTIKYIKIKNQILYRSD